MWAEPSFAHDSGPPHLHLAPAVLIASIATGTMILSALVGLTVYYLVQSRTDRLRGKPTGSQPRSVLPALSGLLLFAAATAIMLRLVSRGPSEAEQRLHGNAEEATQALAELLNKTPEAQRATLLLNATNDHSPGLRYAAVEALSTQHEPGAIELIEQSFADSASSVREHALAGALSGGSSGRFWQYGRRTGHGSAGQAGLYSLLVGRPA
jgi:hypothetical protein